MRTGQPDGVDLAPRDRTLILDAGGEKVIVVLGRDAGDAGEIWDFIQHRTTTRGTGTTRRPPGAGG